MICDAEKKAKRRASDKKWRENNRDRLLAIRKKSEAKNKKRNAELRRESALLRSYGITTAEYDRMLEDQNYQCAICRVDSCSTGRRLSVDHKHDMRMRGGELVDVNKGNSDSIRGLLCQACNTAIGKLKDSPELLRAAAHYIEGNEYVD